MGLLLSAAASMGSELPEERHMVVCSLRNTFLQDPFMDWVMSWSSLHTVQLPCLSTSDAALYPRRVEVCLKEFGCRFLHVSQQKSCLDPVSKLPTDYTGFKFKDSSAVFFGNDFIAAKSVIGKLLWLSAIDLLHDTAVSSALGEACLHHHQQQSQSHCTGHNHGFRSVWRLWSRPGLHQTWCFGSSFQMPQTPSNVFGWSWVFVCLYMYTLGQLKLSVRRCLLYTPKLNGLLLCTWVFVLITRSFICPFNRHIFFMINNLPLARE